jgi:pilus assembly protein Flp/PilA
VLPFSNSLKFDLQSGRVLQTRRAGDGSVHTLFPKLVKDASGVTAIEYALIAALIAVAAIAAFSLVGANLSNTFSYVASHL